MPFGATPSRWCVCQFHHFRIVGQKQRRGRTSIAKGEDAASPRKPSIWRSNVVSKCVGHVRSSKQNSARPFTCARRLWSPGKIAAAEAETVLTFLALRRRALPHSQCAHPPLAIGPADARPGCSGTRGTLLSRSVQLCSRRTSVVLD